MWPATRPAQWPMRISVSALARGPSFSRPPNSVAKTGLPRLPRLRGAEGDAEALASGPISGGGTASVAGPVGITLEAQQMSTCFESLRMGLLKVAVARPVDDPSTDQDRPGARVHMQAADDAAGIGRQGGIGLYAPKPRGRGSAALVPTGQEVSGRGAGLACVSLGAAA